MENFKVSVIIPVFNAARFINKAVESAIAHTQVSEIILVEDGSTDHSFEICLELKEKYGNRINLICHPGRINKGAAASRNLGIDSAQNEFLAFLDADDYFLDNRFSIVADIFNKNPDADGVYEAIGTHYYDEIGKKLHQKRMGEINEHQNYSELTTLTRIVKPELLFSELLTGKCGWFHFNALTLKKSVFLKVGLLDTSMKVGEDTDLFFRLAIQARLYPGCLDEPVALRGVYEGNGTLSVFTDSERIELDNYFNAYMWRKFFMKIKDNQFTLDANRFLTFKHLDYYNTKIIKMPMGNKRKLYKIFLLYCLILNNPYLILKLKFER